MSEVIWPGVSRAVVKSGEQQWLGQAPSNIALIKYMGKSDSRQNRPTNASLSYTLTNLCTHVELEVLGQGPDRWAPLPGYFDIQLSEKGQERFLRHLRVLKEKFAFSGSFRVRSANNFPSDCGLASSASSFAALTLTATSALTDLTGRPSLAISELADLSRQGSGSSCRSLFAPWAIWDGEGARALELPIANLIHQVILVEDGRKSVSSSEAHLRVASSLNFSGRPQRAEERLQRLLQSLRAGPSSEWREAMETCWAEFWDMHALFETSRPAFGYMTAGSFEVLAALRNEIWGEYGDGPIVTMDAGANIHLLYRPESAALANRVATKFAGRYRVISTKANTAGAPDAGQSFGGAQDAGQTLGGAPDAGKSLGGAR